MTGQDDVVIADGIGEEIGGLVLVGKSDDLLRATEIGLGLIPQEFTFRNEMARQIARHLEDGDGTSLHVAAYGNADARLKVGVELITLYHVERNGAVGEEYLAALRIHV